MAHVDLTRSALDARNRKRLAGVRMQQGRVLTDDDFNEAGAIDAEEERRALVDIIGPTGTPDDGFKVVDGSAQIGPGGLLTFQLDAGTIYVGGIRVEAHERFDFHHQPDFLRQRDGDRIIVAPDGTRAVRSLAYLEVWQQPVSAVEDAELLEVALGGPDTSQRVRTMARVRLHHTATDTCAAAFGELVGRLEADKRGRFDRDQMELRADDLRLLVTFDPTADEEDLCAPQAAEGYLAARNSAIRVQLVGAPGAPPAIAWGFDNSAPLYRVRIDDSGPDPVVTFVTLPRDQAHWPLDKQIVEIVPWDAVLSPNRELLGEGHGRAETQVGGEPLSVGHSHFAKVKFGFKDDAITLDGALPAGLFDLAPSHQTDLDEEPREFDAFLRVWDRGSDLESPPAIELLGTGPTPLGTTGLSVEVLGDHTGADAHWIVAARPETPRTVVPWSLDAEEGGREPHGVRTYLAPLALITWEPTVGVPEVVDCRIPFEPLTRLRRGCCTYTVGDGLQSHGDYTSIQTAIDALPAEGGRICVLPGIYEETLQILHKRNVHIEGCGDRSVIRPTPGVGDIPAIRVQLSVGIRLCALRIEWPEYWGITVAGGTWGKALVADVHIEDCAIESRDHGAVLFRGGRGHRLTGSQLFAEALVADPDPANLRGRLPAVWIQASDVIVDGNTLIGRGTSRALRRGPSGIQVASTSTGVTITGNVIRHGGGHGIVLGSVGPDRDGADPAWRNPLSHPLKVQGESGVAIEWPEAPVTNGAPAFFFRSEGPILDLHVADNQIEWMDGDGIGICRLSLVLPDKATGEDPWPFDVPYVDGLRIERNRIRDCCQVRMIDPDPASVGALACHGPIVLGDARALVVRDNELARCGASSVGRFAAISTWLVTGATIERNRAEDNGRPDREAAPGFHGGVVLRGVMPREDLFVPSSWDGRFALELRDNQIDTPSGTVLFVLGLGPMVAQGNVLTAPFGPSWIGPTFGNGIFVMNVGAATERWGSETPLGEEPGGVLQLQDNSVMLRDQGGGDGFVAAAHLVMSMDTVVMQGNTLRADSGARNLFTQLLALARQTQVQQGRFQETPGRAQFSAVAAGTVAGMLDHDIGTHCFLLLDRATLSDGHSNIALVERSGTDQKCFSGFEGDFDIQPGDADYTKRVDGVLKDRSLRLVRPVGPPLPMIRDAVPARVRYVAREAEFQALKGQAMLETLIEQRVAALDRAIDRAPGTGLEPHVARMKAASKELQAVQRKTLDALVRAAAEVRSRLPERSKGVSIYGTVNRKADAAAGITVALLGADGEVVDWTTADERGWYTLRADAAAPSMAVQISDAKGTVLAKEALPELTAGTRVQRALTIPEGREGAAPPPQVGVRPETPTEPIVRPVVPPGRLEAVLRQRTDLETRANALELRLAALAQRLTDASGRRDRTATRLDEVSKAITDRERTIEDLVERLRVRRADDAPDPKLAQQLERRREVMREALRGFTEQQTTLRSESEQLGQEIERVEGQQRKIIAELGQARSAIEGLVAEENEIRRRSGGDTP